VQFGEHEQARGDQRQRMDDPGDPGKPEIVGTQPRVEVPGTRSTRMA
jgi:hypothetical protein